MIYSVIIPAFRQAKTIVEDLCHIEDVLTKIRYDYEMIVVNDGSPDATYVQMQEFLQNHAKFPKKITLLTYPKNQGKGNAVRYGMSKAKGEYISFIDSGMDINPNGLSILLEHMEWYDAEIIVGSKRHPASKVEYPLIRRIYSTGYQLLCSLLFGLNVKDTQTGMKIFRRQVLIAVMPRLLIKKWAFDIEMLAVAHHLGFTKIYEAPIELVHIEFNTSINRKVVIKMLWDTIAVFYRMHILHYYDESNKNSWNNPDYQKISSS
ncbi:MAG: glycosyltransferase [bacterium]|nr:glycosyltransferase [bacterium]